MIEGVQVIPLKTFLDERGIIKHMLKCTDPHFSQFGEIYFSVIFPGAIKGWHVHTKMELNYAVIVGNIKLVLYDARDDSPTYQDFQEIYMGEDNYVLVKIPVNVVNGFKAIGNEKAIVANCSSIPHDPEEIGRLDPLGSVDFIDPSITYNWGIRHG